MMIAEAQPTPGFTEIAEAGQFLAQAPHSMHLSRPSMRALPSARRKTACGQTSTQAPHPTHAPSSRTSVSPFFMYDCFIP